MTAFTNTLGFQFRVTEVTGNSFDALTRQNVKKRVENILYINELPADAVKLSYVGSSEISVPNLLYIGDRSDSLYQNSRDGRIEEYSSTVQPVPVANNNFIITQQFKEAESGDVPLYYSHQITEDYKAIIADSIRLYDKNLNTIGDDKFKIVLEKEYDLDTGNETGDYLYYQVFNNLESYYDSNTSEYQVYYIQYTQVINGIDTTITKLLSNNLAFPEATDKDIWYGVSGTPIKPWSRAYVYDSLNSKVYLPIGGKYSVKYQETRKLSVSKPVRTDTGSPWFPRIAVGSFSTAGYRYRVPEFSEQSFNPIEPYKTAAFLKAYKIDDYIIKLPHENIKSGELLSLLYIEVKKDGVLKYALTNDNSIDGSDYLDMEANRVYDDNGDIITWSSENLLGLDELSGIVNTKFHILDSYDIYATYSYEEKYYELNSLNMNPLFDLSVSSQTRAIYVVPESIKNKNIGKQTESVRWVKISNSGIIINTNQSGSGGNKKIDFNIEYKNDGYSIDGILGMHYNRRSTANLISNQEIISNGSINITTTVGFPTKGWIRFVDATTGYIRYVEYIDKTKTALELSSDIPFNTFALNGTNIELVNFVDEFTTLSTHEFAEEEVLIYPELIPSVESRYFILGELSVNPPHGIEELVKIDVRENGGGIIQEKYEDAKARQPESQWLSENNSRNGQIYPGNAVEVIKIPAYMLNQYTELEIKDIVDKSVPVGIKPLIRYYGYTPEIISITPVITLKEEDYGFGNGPFGDYLFGG